MVGAPGTGKTDVAAQIIATVYANHPLQKTLIVTNNDRSLNELCAKLLQRNVDPRHLVSLGAGETELREGMVAGDSLGRTGRVQWSLQRRQTLLGYVQALGQSLQTPSHFYGDVGANCETAGYFFESVIKPMMETQRQQSDTPFLFERYAASNPILHDVGSMDVDDHTRRAVVMQHIESMFAELKDYRAYELLRGHGHRCDYLLSQQVRFFSFK